MSISLSVLGSGSSGNCAVVVLGDGTARRVMLIDAGLSPRQTSRRLAAIGVAMEDVTDVMLTHLDGDHLHTGWRMAAPRLRMHWHVHREHGPSARRAGVAAERLRSFGDHVEIEGEWTARTAIDSVRLPHDELGTSGFVISHGGQRLGYATDLGHVPEALLERFVDLDALALESNYDPQMQVTSPRPTFLKQRIMGGHGHLSNEQSLEAVLRIDSCSRLRHVALLHLSRQCNDPAIIESLYEAHAPHLAGRLTISTQHQSTPLLHVGRPRQRQMELSFSAAPVALQA